MTLIAFTLSNARRFYSSMGNPLETKGLINTLIYIEIQPSKRTFDSIKGIKLE